MKLSKIPISLFSVIMGIMGVTLASARLEKVFNLPHNISLVWLWTGVVIFAVVSLLYLLKVFFAFESVKAEFFHPVALSFFATVSVATILVGQGLRLVSSPVGEKIFVAGSVLQFLFSLAIISSWLKQSHFEIQHMNPSWFIPAVGNILVPALGDFLPPWIQWFFLSIGGFLWFLLMVILFYRLIFHHPLPDKLIPTLFILIAPPSVMAIALSKMSGQEMAIVFYWIAFFFVLILFTFINWFTKIRFALSWWAYTFPLAAFTIASVVLSREFPFLLWVGVGTGIVLNIVVLGLFFFTMLYLLKGKLFEGHEEKKEA
ncbi:C4-dicarboxylate transporter/malic acid transport protein [Brevinematales bacterium NS]|jgi:tellurite resistance protein|nr:C4-dicarboxylate ABC transporter [Brevinematales bacterium]QJR21928.1 C4-dicarboxylate transporter/malic acid transport protein [Brevinematales bacterium NS]